MFIYWSLCLVYHNAWWLRLGVMERMCMLREEELDGLLVVPPLSSCPRCTSVWMPQGISSGTPEEVIVRDMDTEILFQKIRFNPCVRTGHPRDLCDVPRALVGIGRGILVWWDRDCSWKMIDAPPPPRGGRLGARNSRDHGLARLRQEAKRGAR